VTVPKLITEDGVQFPKEAELTTTMPGTDFLGLDSSNDEEENGGLQDTGSQGTTALAISGSDDGRSTSVCKKYFKTKGKSNIKVIFTMAKGLTKKAKGDNKDDEEDDEGQSIPLVDFDAELYTSSNKKKKFLPLARDYKEEILHRANVMQLPRIPKPVQWQKAKIEKWLCNQLISAPECVKWIMNKVHLFTNL